MYYVSTKKKKKKKDWERTRLSEEITSLNVTVTQHRDLAPFLFCALFVLRTFCSAPFLLCALFVLRLFCCALIVRALFVAPKCLVSCTKHWKCFESFLPHFYSYNYGVFTRTAQVLKNLIYKPLCPLHFNRFGWLFYLKRIDRSVLQLNTNDDRRKLSSKVTLSWAKNKNTILSDLH